MTDSIEWSIQQLISKVEESQPLIDDLELQNRQLKTQHVELQKILAEKDAELQRAVSEKDAELQRVVSEKDAELQRLSDDKNLLGAAKGEAEHRFSELNQAFEKQKKSLLSKTSEAKEASEQCESALLQLQQVQEELEYYFLLNQKKSKMLDSFEGLNQRMATLFSSLTTKS